MSKQSKAEREAQKLAKRLAGDKTAKGAHNQGEAYKEFVRCMDELCHRNDRRTVFDDFLTITICCLAMGRMEELYLKTIAGYREEEVRGVIPKMLGMLFVSVSNDFQTDMLGDYFMEHVTANDHGQHFTPNAVNTLMKQITEAGLEGPGEEDTGRVYWKRVSDPTCGSGRTLITFAEEHPQNFFYGWDIDHRCARMAAINLAVRGLAGEILWGNPLTMEMWRCYRVNLLPNPFNPSADKRLPAWSFGQHVHGIETADDLADTYEGCMWGQQKAWRERREREEAERRAAAGGILPGMVAPVAPAPPKDRPAPPPAKPAPRAAAPATEQGSLF